MSRFTLLLGSACLALASHSASLAQQADASGTDDGIASAEDIIVTGKIFFRNRTVDPNPVLSYDLEYFQKFEPVSVGEMLKRVPGVTFTSDVLEYDQPQFRGLPPGYTQVLINGRRAPGGESDGSFFVDRIPAELVERIEIVRSPRADQPSEGTAGTLNIITKESASFEGGFLKAGALINTRDGGTRPSFAGAFAGHLDEATDFWIAGNYQQRRNPKKKLSYRFSDTPTTHEDGFPSGFDSPYVNDSAFDNIEAQDDTRDGTDVSGSAEITHHFGAGGYFRIGGFFVDTDRDEDETSVTHEMDDGELEFDGVETQHEDISQQTYAITADAKIPFDSFELGLAAGWNGYRENTTTTAYEGENEDDYTDVELDEEETIHIKDDEYTGTIYGAFGDSDSLRVKIGVDLFHKNREGLNDGDFVSDSFTIKEDRYDPYARLTFHLTPQFSVDAGVRYQITRREVDASTVGANYNNESLNPSLHLMFEPTSRDQFRASLARTVRRPAYDLLSPITYDETPGDDDTTTGNPALRNERAWGVDIGYERRLGAQGVLGINFFYRSIDDLIELVSLGNVGEGDGQDFMPANIGDGKTWGVEFDFSTPLNIFSFGETGLFANYTYMDSETTDPFTGEKRRFNNQPHHIYNIGFIQNIEPAAASFGVTLSGRSSAFESNLDETVNLRYDPDLEAFIEKRIGRHLVLRISAQNLLDRVKKEDFNKWDGDSVTEILENRFAGDLDEYEIEREHSGPLLQVTLRAAF